MSQQVIVLNQDYSFLNLISWEDAVCLIYLKKAEVLAESDRIISNCDKSFQYFAPYVLRLKNMVTKIFRPRTTYNRRNVFFRDDWKCQYCGKDRDFVYSKRYKDERYAGKKVHLTIDHVTPRAHGGKTSYDNCVTACEECNQLKADRTPEQAHMKLRKLPTKPNLANYFNQKMKSLKIDERLRELGVYS
jgi:5-methylcytosine-specific restriction endonuclease McrA